MENKKYTKIQKVPKKSKKYLLFYLFLQISDFFRVSGLQTFSGKKKTVCIFFSFKKWRKKNFSNRVGEWGVNYSRQKKNMVPMLQPIISDNTPKESKRTPGFEVWWYLVL